MPIQTQTVPAFMGGMVTDVVPWGLDDSQCRFAQDVLFDKPNLARRRGILKEATTVGGTVFSDASDSGYNGVGIVGVRAPDSNDTWRIATLFGKIDTDSAKLKVYANSYTSTTNVSLTGEYDPAKRYAYQSAPVPGAGIVIGTSQGYGGNRQQQLFQWAGASATDDNTGTLTVVAGATGFTLTGTSNIEPGSFLFARTDQYGASGDRTFIGVVASFSGTSGQLVDASPWDVTSKGARVRSVRPINRHVAKGLITTSKTSKVVQGSGTKFKRQGLDAPTGGTNGRWAIFRSDDMKYIGLVDYTESGSVGGIDYDNGVANDIQLLLASNAAINCNKDKFVAIDMFDGRDYKISSGQEPGFLPVWWANRMWYGCRKYSTKGTPHSIARVFFSDTLDHEALDLTADGDNILIPNDKGPIRPITGMLPTPSALAVFKEEETHAIFGTDETNFSRRKILDDGCLYAQAAQPYGGGVVWAGKKGIYYWDGGEEPFNLLEGKNQKFYEKAVATHSAIDHFAAMFIHRDHMFLCIERATVPFGPVLDAGSAEGTGSPTPYLNIIINMQTRAFSTATNLNFMGGVKPPYENAQGGLYIFNAVNSSNVLDRSHIGQMDDLFDTTGVDVYYTRIYSGGSVAPWSTATPAKGPYFYLETKRYDLEDPQTKKRFKQLQMVYKLQSTTGAYVTQGNVDPDVTFGETTLGPTPYPAAADFKFSSKFTLASAIALTTVHARLNGNGGGVGSQVVKAVVYSNNAGSPDALLATSNEKTVVAGAATATVEFTFSPTVALAAGDYHIGLIFGATTNVINMITKSAGSGVNMRYNFDSYVGGAANPWGSVTTYDSTINIWATGPTAGGATDYAANYLKFALIQNMNETSQVLAATWPLTRTTVDGVTFAGGFLNTRKKTRHKGSHIGYRIWQNNLTTIKDVEIGPLAIGFKWMRPGKV